MKRAIGKILIFGVIFLAAVFVLMQFIPYGRNHSNPPVVQEPAWNAPETRALAVRACFDCHSNETVWPWYSYVAPVSWLTQRDVDEGRQKLNFSDIINSGEEGREAGETVLKGEMPPFQYFPTHPEARLTNAERQQLALGLDQTLGGESQSEGESGD